MEYFSVDGRGDKFFKTSMVTGTTPGSKDNEIFSTEFREASKKLKFAYRIFFLGFGYHEMNLIRLNLNEVFTDNIFGTAFKLDKTDINRIKELGISIPDDKYNILQEQL